MMFSIVNDKVGDCVVVEGETITDCQTQTMSELNKRGWDMNDCHSIPLDE